MPSYQGFMTNLEARSYVTMGCLSYAFQGLWMHLY